MDASAPREYPAHVPDHCKAGLEVANANYPLAQLKGDASSVLDRLRDGESAVTISKSLGISDVALYTFLLRNAPEQWQEIAAGKALSRYEKAKTDLDVAADQVGIGKARASGTFAQWDLERANRKLYGDNKQDSSGITIQVLIARDGVSTSLAREPLCEFTAAPQQEPLGSGQVSGPPTTTCSVAPPVAGSALHHGDA